MNAAVEEDVDSQRDTIPSGIQSVPPLPIPQKPSLPIKSLLWGLAFCLGVLLASVTIAVSVSFWVDYAMLGGGAYAAGVLLSSFALGGLTASGVWMVRR